MHDDYYEKCKKYSEFDDLFYDAQFELNWDHEKMLDFYFHFGFRFFITIWDDFYEEDKARIKELACTHFKCDITILDKNICELRNKLPKYSCTEDVVSSNRIGWIRLVEDLFKSEDLGAEYTFGEAFSCLPADINYPVPYAFEVLNGVVSELEKNRQFKGPVNGRKI